LVATSQHLAAGGGSPLLLGFGPPRLTARDLDPTPLSAQQVQQLVHLKPPAVTAGAALVVDIATQTVLYQKEANRRWAPASTTKMMTAMVALERGNLNDLVTVQAQDLSVASAIGLAPGEVWRLEDLVYDLLLPSDNAVGRVIGRHIAGSEEAFVALMNAEAARWGLQDTHFVNTHGLDEPEHYSTAHDLAQIALHALSNPTFARMVSTPTWQVKQRTLRNTNELLGVYPGTIGVKTGTTDEAGDCLVSAASRADGQVLCVVLGSTDRYADSRVLLDYYYTNYSSVLLTLGPKGLNRVSSADGAPAVLVLRDQRRVLLARWQRPWLGLQRTGALAGMAGAEGSVGTARYTLGTALLAEMPMYAAAP
jgi:serine-type D-Ala-D-Ala carboxypeptidase (penicillin-binding protein 5/6)